MAKEIALIGSGNMGGGMLKGIVKAGLVQPSEVIVADAFEAAQQRLAGELGCTGTCDNVEAVKGAKVVLLAVKPQFLDSAVEGFATSVEKDAVVVSIAAGVTLAHLESLFPEGTKIVRVMPNLNATVLEAMSAICPNEHVSKEEVAHVKELFEGFGKAEIIKENLMDAVVAVSGSAPAYVCMFIEAMADAAVIEGMPRAQAYTFAEQAVLGTAKYLQETGTHPAVLKDMVSSPAGTTIAAVSALEDGAFRSTVINAMLACAQRNRELG